MLSLTFWQTGRLLQSDSFVRTDGALVRVITPVYEFEKLEDAEETEGRLEGFTRQIVSALADFIPGKDIE